MSIGGGGGDGGAAAARQQEEDRQARIRAAVDRINAIFNGTDVNVVTDRATSYTPGQTLHNADGSVFVAPTKQVEVQVGGGLGGSGFAPNVYAPGGDAGGSYYDPKQDPSVGRWAGSGDAGQRFITNPGVYAKTTGGDADNLIGYFSRVAAPDTDAINKALQDGLFTGVRTIKGLDRNQLYREQRDAVTQLNQREVSRQHEDAERQNRFGLARAGLAGGSVDVDSNAEINRINDEGMMKAVGLGQAAASDLRTQDERTRQNLIGMAQSGIDTGQAAQLALSGLDANASAASSARAGATIGNLFGDLANVYAHNQQMNAFNQGYGPYRNQNAGWSARERGDQGRVQ